MAKTDFKNADEYLATFSPENRKILEIVRKTIRAAVPEAEEVISYQIPAFKKDGVWIFYYSGYKAHYALACPPPFAAFKAFAKFKLKEGEKKVVTFLKESPKTQLKLPIEKDNGRMLAQHGSEVFTVYIPDPTVGAGFMGVLERALGKAQTTRTWGTVQKCAAG